MKGLKTASILMVPIAGSLCGYGQAAASAPGNSAAAQGCLQEPMTAYYMDTTLKDPGADLQYKLFQNHGSCVSFFAQYKAFIFQYAVKIKPGE